MRTKVWHKILIAPCLIALVSVAVIHLRHPTQQTTQRKWFRAVTHIPSTLQGKTRTQLFFDIGQHSILLGIGGAPTNTGFSVSVDHSNPLIAGEIAEGVARVLRNQMAVGWTNALPASYQKVE
jgi:hypothetical protein